MGRRRQGFEVPGRRWLGGVAGMALAAALAACSGASVTPEPAGPLPSAISTEVCSHKAQTQITEALGQATTSVSTPTWIDHLYSCSYLYVPQGRITLSVQELSSKSETTAYFDQLARRLGDKQVLYGLGQGAFETDDGSVVVRKDWKVLLVDSVGLTGTFSSSNSVSGTPAETIASVIMACWAGD